MPRSDQLSREELLERQAFQLALLGKLRDLDDGGAILAVAARMLGEKLDAGRCGFGAISEDGEIVRVDADWSGPLGSLVGETRMLDSFGPSLVDELRRGDTIVVTDSDTDPRTLTHSSGWASISTRALIVCPVMKDGLLDGIFYAHTGSPRNWTLAEIALVEDVSLRTREAVERVRSEAALKASREELELATRAAELGRYDYRPRDGTLAWDDRCRQLFGLPPGSPVTYESAFLAGLHPDDRERADAAVAASLDPDGTHRFDVEYRTVGIKDGLLRHIRAQGLAFFDGREPVRLIGTVQDVTRDREASAKLREVEERLRLAGRATNDAIWDWDFRTDHVTWNEALERAYGHRLQDVEPTGGWWIAQIHPEDRPRIDRSIHHVIDGSGTDWTDEYRFRRGDGSYADIFDRGYVIRDGEGTPIRMVGAMLDLSARKAVERQLEEDRARLREEVRETTAERDRAEEALRQSQKMEAVGQLTGGIAHDFNNLLTGISGSLEMMQVRIAQGRLGELEKYSVAAQGALRRASALTHRLLAFSRRQTLDPKPCDVNRLIFDLEELVRRTVGPAIEVETVGKAGLWTTLVDTNQLENAILNLCINARDAMPDGGRITIETANKWLDARGGKERDLEPGQYVSICVTDTGTGMTQDVATRAFDPFFTTKPLGEGTGLGLSMIYGFARQSGGQVRIYTEVGMGTTMCIYLPRHLDGEEMIDAASTPQDNPPELSPGTHAGTVLVVDDEPTIRMLVVEVAEELGYNVLETFDGPSAMRILQANEKVDLLITDVGLPGGMNGRQVADAALSLYPALKVLFITGYAENAVIGNGQLAPNMALITKPFAMEALGQRINEIMG